MKRSLISIAMFLFAAISVADPEVIRERLHSAAPEIPIADIFPAPIDGMYEVVLNNGESLYASKNGEYFLLGQLFKVTENSFVNLSEEKRNVARKAQLAEVKDTDTIEFPSKGKEKAVIHVFTDVDCGYCRKLHAEIDAINELGITVRYLGYPRAGIGSGSYQKLQSAWCSEDRAAALTQMKSGKSAPTISCDSQAVAKQYKLGQEMGVTGTPAIITSEGRLIPGYMPANRLARELGL